MKRENTRLARAMNSQETNPHILRKCPDCVDRPSPRSLHVSSKSAIIGSLRYSCDLRKGYLLYFERFLKVSRLKIIKPRLCNVTSQRSVDIACGRTDFAFEIFVAWSEYLVAIRVQAVRYRYVLEWARFVGSESQPQETHQKYYPLTTRQFDISYALKFLCAITLWNSLFGVAAPPSPDEQAR